MVVYFGGSCEIQTPEIKPSRNNKDFGPGFYCTELLAQAERWSRRFDTPVVTSYEYTPNPDLDILNFDQMTEEWLDFIVACRNGTPHSHDIVVGAELCCRLHQRNSYQRTILGPGEIQASDSPDYVLYSESLVLFDFSGKQGGGMMTGREDRRENDLFFVCSLIEAIGRKTKNHRRVVVNSFEIAEIRHLLELADVYHSENMEKLIDNLTEKYYIPQGTFDNVSTCRYAVPSIFDIGKVYKRLIVAVSQTKGIDFPNALIEVYNSWIADRLDDYNSSMFFENPEYIYQSYLTGQPLPQ